MPVYHVTIIHPNGNRCSRPIVASCQEHAVDYMRAEHCAQGPSYRVEVKTCDDPDGAYEQLLRDAERRRYDAELWERWDRR